MMKNLRGINERRLATVILAAGKGKRMQDPDMPKVLYTINGKPMIDYVLALALKIGSEKTIVVVGHQRDRVVEYISAKFTVPLTFVEQREQLGTGDAVLQTKPELEAFHGNVLVLSGDVPFLRGETLTDLIETHNSAGAVATILTAEARDPTGYGRIVRYRDGSVERIVEERDANEEERALREINSGIYVFKTMELFGALKTVGRHNVQGEYYLTDVFERFWNDGRLVVAVRARDFDEVCGINTKEQLQAAEATYVQKQKR
jgi:UDP-N-acetylglucosamine diphosphorylase/glucosamine-1-phosphate N-acetyltransferase